MGFGISFGSKKNKSTTNSTVTKDTTSSQNTDGSKNVQDSTTESMSKNSQSQGSSNTAQTQTASTNESRASQAATTSQSLSDSIISQLEQVVSSGLGTANRSDSFNIGAMDALGQFDAEEFVNNSVSAARGSIQSQLDSQLGGLAGRIGSGIGNNSMAMLLANRLQSDAQAAIQGVNADATKTAQDIIASQAQVGAQVGSSGVNNVASLLNLLKGATTVTNQTGSETSAGSQASNTSAQTATSEQSSEQATTAKLSVIEEILRQLVSGTESSVGTENTKTTGKTSGGGLSLSI